MFLGLMKYGGDEERAGSNVALTYFQAFFHLDEKRPFCFPGLFMDKPG
jgi:hypothetical protein